MEQLTRNEKIEALIKVQKRSIRARRNYKIEMEFNADRVLSKRELDLLLGLLADQIHNPKDINNNGYFVSASYKTVVLKKSIAYDKPQDLQDEE